MATVTLYMANVFPNDVLERTVFAKIRGQYFRLKTKAECKIYSSWNWRSPVYDTSPIPKSVMDSMKEEVREIWKNPGKYHIVIDKEFKKSLVFISERIYLKTCSHCGHVV